MVAAEEFRIDVVVDPRKAEAGLKKTSKALGRIEKQGSELGRLFRRIGFAIAAAFSARAILRTANEYQELQNRIRIVTNTTEELAQTTRDLLGVSRETRSSLSSTITLYTRLSLSADELGRSQAELLQFTRSLNQAVVISGATATEARNGLLQLSQGLASGALRGDELRSVLEQLPQVASVIAKGLGVTRGELRKLGEQGKITSDIIIDAFEKAREELQDKFGKTVPTLAQGFEAVSNEFTIFIGKLDEAIGGVFEEGSSGLQKLAEGIAFLREALDNFQGRVRSAEDEGVSSATGVQILSLEKQIRLLEARKNLNEDNLRFLDQLRRRLALARGEAQEPVIVQREEQESSERALNLQRTIGAIIGQGSQQLGAFIDKTKEANDELGEFTRVQVELLGPLRDEAVILNALVEGGERLARQKEIEIGLRQEGITATEQEIQLALDLEEQNRRLSESIVETTTFSQGALTALTELRRESAGLALVGQDVVNVFANQATDALTEFATTGKFAFREFASSIIDDLLAITARLLVVQGLSAALTGGTGGGLVGGFASSLGGGGGGLNAGRAGGGTVQPGQNPFPVNEQGQELFVPNRTGTIVPAQASAPATPPVVNLMIVNEQDPKMVRRAIASGEVDDVIVNRVAANRGKFSGALGQ